MLKTHGCNKKLKSDYKKLNFTNIKIGLNKTINQFKKTST